MSFSAIYQRFFSPAVARGFADGSRQTAAVSFGSSQNNFAPGGADSWKETWWTRLDPSSDSLNITGLDATDSAEPEFVFVKVLVNTTPDKVFFLRVQDVLSLAANRLRSPSGHDLPMHPGAIVVVVYNLEETRWDLYAQGGAWDAAWTFGGGILSKDENGLIQQLGLSNNFTLGRNDLASGGPQQLRSIPMNELEFMMRTTGVIADDTGGAVTFPSFGLGPWGDGWYQRIDHSGIVRFQGLAVSGLANGDFRHRKLMRNEGTAPMVFEHESPGATAADRRIRCPNGSDFWVPPGACCYVFRDETDTRWQVLGPSTPYDFTQHFRAQTTDATVTTVGSYLTVPVNERLIDLRVRAIGRQSTTDDVIKDVIEATAYRTGAGAIVIKDINHVSLFRDQAAWNATLDVSGTMIRTRVQGEAGKIIDWRTTMEVSEHV